MFKEFKEIYHFIDEFKENDLKILDKKISIIYRNYKKKTDINILKKCQSKTKLRPFNCIGKVVGLCYENRR